MVRNDDKSKLILQTLCGIMDLCSDTTCRRWFFIFGTLEEFIADLTFSLKFDIDIGVVYNEYSYKKIKDSFANWGYTLSKQVLHDVDKKPLNMHFEPCSSQLIGTPTIDVYFWLPLRNGLLGHCYDVNREGKEVLSEYTFKCIKKSWVIPSETTLSRIRKSGPEMSQVLDEWGIWRYDVYGDHTEPKFRCPFAYGSILDETDPGWRFRDAKRGQSKSKWIYKVKSCADLKRI